MTAVTEIKHRNPKDKTRAIIMTKAREMTSRHLPRLGAVLEDLGYTTGAGYQIWSNQQAFWDDLTDQLAEAPWVVNGHLDQRNIRLALRHCDDRVLGPRFLELDRFGLEETPGKVTGADLLWNVLFPKSWADETDG